MKVKLKVLEGAGRGREFSIPRPQCIVGRGEDCHLKPASSAVSRRHCVIFVKDGNVIVHDFQSRNGTFVNGERIEEDRALKPGDELQIGPLKFEIMIDRGLGGEKKARVKSVKEAAERTISRAPDTVIVDEDDISDWLEEADDIERQRRLSHPEALELRLEETDPAPLQDQSEPRAKEKTDQQEETKKMTYSKSPGKLPRRVPPVAEDSGEAAAEALRGFFRSR